MRQYLEVLREVHAHGVDRESKGSKSRALFGKMMRFDMADGFPIVTTKRVPFEHVKAELLWFLSGSTNVYDLKKLAPNCKIWDADAFKDSWVKKAKCPGDVGRMYGAQWRDWIAPDGRHIDQISEVIANIKKDPYDRRHIVVAWNPGELDQMALAPCHAFFQFFVAKERISLILFQRSCDMFLGVPFNIASYALLLHMVAQATGFEPKEFVHILSDVHVYHNHLEQVKEQLSREPRALPRLWMNGTVRDIFAFQMQDFDLIGYSPHPSIKAEMTVRKEGGAV